MNEALKPGLTYELAYTVRPDKTVPHLYPEFPEFQLMPLVIDVQGFNASVARKTG